MTNVAAVYVSRCRFPASGASDPTCSHAVQLTVWLDAAAAGAASEASGAPTATRGAATSPPTHSLVCYSFLDHPGTYAHLKALLRQQCAAVASLHVAAEKPVRPRALKALERVLRELLDGGGGVAPPPGATGGDPHHAPAPLSSTLTFHGSPPQGKRKSNGLAQVLGHRLTKPAALAVGAHPELAGLLHSNEATPLSVCLELYFRVTNTEQESDTPLEVAFGKAPSFLALDRTAAEAIHLWPPPSSAANLDVHGNMIYAGNQSSTSLFGLLRQPLKTSAGKARLASWLQQPLLDRDEILHRQDAVAWLLDATNGVVRDALQQEGLAGFGSLDLDALASQLETYNTDPDSMDDDSTIHTLNENEGPTSASLGPTAKALQALYKLWLVASQKIPLLRDRLQVALTTNESSNNPVVQTPRLLVQLLDGLVESEQRLERAGQLAEDVLDMDAAPREFRIRTAYKPELEQIHAELVELEDQVQQSLDQMNQDWARIGGTAGAVRLERNGTDCEFEFRLANANDLKLLQATTSFTVKVSRILKNGVYFTTRNLRELATKKQDLQVEYDKYQRELALQAMQAAATYADVLFQAGQLVASLDAIVGLASVAANHNYVRPTLTDGDGHGAGIVLKGARHPCVELQENVDFIPNDVQLVYGESSFLIVTGPNMGGKSTYIRSLGAIVALAQIGAYVPCTSATINICHDILARVGAGDLQERGISTFMAEMLESSSILRRATKRSLIIIDELGRGTSTYDGYGLAAAISEYIVDSIGCLTVFTTHFHELTTLEDRKPGVKNYHVTAKKGDHGLTFLYEVKPGPCLESFGIQVAKMANVPSVVIEDAKIKAKELENFEYSKKSQSPSAVAGFPVDTDCDALEDHEEAESAAANVAFVSRLRRVDLEALLSKEYASDADKKAAVFRAIDLATST